MEQLIKDICKVIKNHNGRTVEGSINLKIWINGDSVPHEYQFDMTTEGVITVEHKQFFRVQ